MNIYDRIMNALGSAPNGYSIQYDQFGQPYYMRDPIDPMAPTNGMGMTTAGKPAYPLQNPSTVPPVVPQQPWRGPTSNYLNHMLGSPRDTDEQGRWRT